MNSTISHADLIRRRILRIHGSFLLVLTIINTIITMVGWMLGKGPLAVWQEQQFAAVGLFQAYLLMFVVGIALWLGSNLERDLWKWDLIGLLAHLPPVAVNFIFADLFASFHFQGMSVFSITLHMIWISIELFAIFYRGGPQSWNKELQTNMK
jgi:amino acid transporter